MSVRKQAMVIGFGQFGTAIAQALVRRGVEVLGVDNDEERLRAVSSFLTDAASFDATDADALARASPERRDICVCAIGEEARESSIICTALLRQMGAPWVVARANTDVHARILKLVGAHVVVNPEREFGERFASQLLNKNILGEMSLGGNLILTEMKVAKWMEGRSLLDLQLPRSFGVTVVATRTTGQDAILLPDAKMMLREGDSLIVVAEEGAVGRMMEHS